MKQICVQTKRENWQPWIILGGLILFFFVEMTYLNLAKFACLHSKYFDLGTMSQAICSAAERAPLIYDGQGIVISRLGEEVPVGQLTVP